MARNDPLAALDAADNQQVDERRQLKAALEKKTRRKEREKRALQVKNSSNSLVSPEGKERRSLEERTPPLEEDKENMTGRTRKLTNKEIESLQKEKNDLEVEKEAWTKKEQTMEKDFQRMDKAYQEAMAENATYGQDFGDMEQENKDYREENETLKQQLRVALKALKDAGKHARFEESKEVNVAIREFIKGQGYREWKFIRTDEKKGIFVDCIYDHIAERIGMADSKGDFYVSKKDFHRIYSGSCIKKLGDRRQLSQTMMLKSCISFYKKHQYLPTPDQIKNIWTKPDDGSDEYAAWLIRFVWYVDCLLPAMVGFDQFGPNIRRYNYIVDTVTIDGKKKPQVTIKSEAFGWVTYENCYTKWTHVVPKKVEDYEWTAPAYDKEVSETHKWHVTKWSDSRSGQVPGGGWAPGAYTALNNNVKAILKFRKADHANEEKKWKMVKFAYTQIRAKYNITARHHSNKRKRKKAPAVELQYDDILDIEDDYSVGSDVSRGEI